MTLITEQAQLLLTVDGKQSFDELSKYEVQTKMLAQTQKQLTAEMQKYKNELEEVRKRKYKAKEAAEALVKSQGANSEKAKEAILAYQNLGKQENNLIMANIKHEKVLKQNTAELENARIKVDELRNSQGLSLRQSISLTYEQKKIQQELSTLTFGTEEYTKSLNRLNDIQAELDRRTEISGRKNGTGAAVSKKILPEPSDVSIIDSITGKLTGMLSVGNLLVVSFSLLSSAIFKAWDSSRELGKAIGGLTAITSIEKNSEDLAFYVKEAQLMGDAFGESTPKIIEAMQVVGSLKSELLDNKEALAQTTEQVLVLSGAAGDLLPVKESASAVMGSLNQFGETADQAQRYINVLAASAKEGSSEIQQTAEAFQTAGVMLKENNITFEQSNALVQVLASKMIVGSEAGTALRNIFSKLMVTSNQDLNPSIVGLNTSLDNLAKLSPQEIVKLFGEESQVAAKILIEQRKEVDKLTTAVTGTNEAYDQFNKRMDDLDGDVKHLGEAFGGIFEDLGIKYEGVFRKITQFTTEILNQIRYFKIEFGGDSIIKVQTYGDVQEQRSLAENYKKIATKAQADARSTMSDFTKSNSNEPLLKKQLNGLNSVIQQSQAGIAMVMDKYHKARAKNLSQNEIQDILNDKKYWEEKYKFARLESQRLVKLDAEAQETKKRLKEGYDKENEKESEKNNKKAAAKAQKHQEEKLKNEINTIAEIAKLDNQALDDSDNEYEGQLRMELSLAMVAKRKELGDSKEAKQEYNQWELAAFAELNQKLAKHHQETEDKKLKAAEETAQKLLELTDRNAKAVIQSNITQAENKGDTLGAFNGKIALIEFEREAELRNKKLTEEQKLEIDKFYNAQREQAFAELLDKEKNLTQKQNQEKLQLEIESSKNDFFVNYNAKVSLLNFEYAQELMNAEKTGQSVENIHKKYANKRKDIDKELWNAIANFATQSYTMISDGLTNSRNLDIQAEQINLDNQKGRRLAALDAELKSGQITKSQYDAKKLKAEEEFEKKQKVIKRKQAEAEHDANVIKATQSAIQSILQTMSSVPYPFNIPLAAIQAGLAFDQVSKLSAMPIPEFFDGGYTGSGGNAPKVNDGRGGFLAVMHPNELTFSAADLQTDWGRAAAKIYEARSINNSVINNTSSSTAQPVTQNSTNNDNMALAITLQRINDTQKELNDILKSGIVAKNLWTAHDVDNLSILQDKNSTTKKNSLN